MSDRAVYQFKAILLESRPAVWRRFQVWENITLPQLHRVLQNLMGWLDYHLHEFRIAHVSYSDPAFELDELEDEHLDEREIRLNRVLTRVGERIHYLYDFGDSWLLELLLETVSLPEDGALYPRCIDGGRNAPPEDVGGIPGFEEFVKVIRNPRHREYEDMLRWSGPYNPDEVPLDRINEALRKEFRLRRKKADVPAPLPEPKTVRRGRAIPIELSAAERNLILAIPTTTEELLEKLRAAAPAPRKKAHYFLTLHELEFLAKDVKRKESSLKVGRQRNGLQDLYEKLNRMLENYVPED